MTKLTKAPPPTLADAVDVTWYKTRMRMYAISDDTLEKLTAGFNSLYLVVFGICVGAGVSIGIAWRETTVDANKPYYCGLFVAIMGLAVISGIVGITNYVRAYLQRKRLYEESVPLKPPS
jgi:hypothetical protein